MLLPLHLNLSSAPGDTTLVASLVASASLAAALTTDIQLSSSLSGIATVSAELTAGVEPLPVTATWPVTLPNKILQAQYTEGQPDESAIRSPTASGPPKQRNRYTALNLPFSGIFEMNSAQVDIFWAFYRGLLGNGAIRFGGLPHLRTGATVNHRFNVSQPPRVTPDGWDSYRVTVSLDVVP